MKSYGITREAWYLARWGWYKNPQGITYVPANWNTERILAGYLNILQDLHAKHATRNIEISTAILYKNLTQILITKIYSGVFYDINKITTPRDCIFTCLYISVCVRGRIIFSPTAVYKKGAIVIIIILSFRDFSR